MGQFLYSHPTCQMSCFMFLFEQETVKVCFATCFDTDILNDLRAQEGKLLSLKPTSADITYKSFVHVLSNFELPQCLSLKFAFWLNLWDQKFVIYLDRNLCFIT